MPTIVNKSEHFAGSKLNHKLLDEMQNYSNFDIFIHIDV